MKSHCLIALLPIIVATLGGCGALDQISDAQAQHSVMSDPLQKSRAAIAQCRDKRIRKEIATYRESAECSNPTIFTAWTEARYPHMDLVNVWLNARLAASDKVDKGVISPYEFERQMAELTKRLTIEERKRRYAPSSVQDNENTAVVDGNQVATVRYLSGLSALESSEPDTAQLGDITADAAKDGYRNDRLYAAPAKPKSALAPAVQN
jgi:hypothetical protein